MEKRNSIQYILRKGSMRGVLSALMGSLVFALANVAAIPIYTHTLELWAVDIFLIALIIGIFLSIIPGLYGGRWLARSLYQDTLAGLLTKKRAIVKGTLVGMLAGLLVCILALFAYTRGDFNILVFRIISAISIAGWMGGWTGLELAKVLMTLRVFQQPPSQEERGAN